MAATYGFIACIVILCPSATVVVARAIAVIPSLLADASGGPCALMVNTRGYKCEEHEVTTQDGYVLSLQRIPEGRSGGSSKNGGNKQPVLLQHGITVDGISWIVNSPEESLPFMLADKGFDVWIANTRGTTYSRRHASFDPSDKTYWNWSWDELAMYDFPSNVDYVYKKTGTKVHNIGHSLGTLMALASLSEGQNNMVDKLKSVTLLSPVAYLSHQTTAMAQMWAMWPRAYQGQLNYMSQYLDKLLGLAEFDPKAPAIASYMEALCRYYNCFNMIQLFTGNNCCLNASTVELFFKHEPQPTSTKNVNHLMQIVEKGFPAKYDYKNREANIEKYGQSEPPAYNLTNFPHELPLFIGTGEIDGIADTQDMRLLLHDLRFHDAGKMKTLVVKGYGHIDVVLAINANRMLYDELIGFLNAYSV